MASRFNFFWEGAPRRRRFSLRLRPWSPAFGRAAGTFCDEPHVGSTNYRNFVRFLGGETRASRI